MFERIKEINAPTKSHTCNFCKKPIIGKHVYGSCFINSEFFTFRAHKECHEKSLEICCGCEYKSDCQGDRFECFSNNMSTEER